MNTDNQKTILTLSKIVGSTPQPGVSREAVMSIYGFRFLARKGYVGKNGPVFLKDVANINRRLAA